MESVSKAKSHCSNSFNTMSTCSIYARIMFHWHGISNWLGSYVQYCWEESKLYRQYDTCSFMNDAWLSAVMLTVLLLHCSSQPDTRQSTQSHGAVGVGVCMNKHTVGGTSCLSLFFVLLKLKLIHSHLSTSIHPMNGHLFRPCPDSV